MMLQLARLQSSCDPIRYDVARSLVVATLAIDCHNVCGVDASDCVQLLFDHTNTIVDAGLCPGLIARA